MPETPASGVSLQLSGACYERLWMPNFEQPSRSLIRSASGRFILYSYILFGAPRDLFLEKQERFHYSHSSGYTAPEVAICVHVYIYMYVCVLSIL